MIAVKRAIWGVVETKEAVQIMTVTEAPRLGLLSGLFCLARGRIRGFMSFRQAIPLGTNVDESDFLRIK